MTDEVGRFTLERVAEDRYVVRVAAYCGGGSRSEADEAVLTDALASCQGAVAIDLTGTKVCTSVWLRFFGRLAQAAKRLGKRVVLVGMSETVANTTDALALTGKVHAVGTLDEAWNSA